MMGPNDPLNPDIPDPNEAEPGTPNLPPEGEPEDDFGEGDTPEAVPDEPANG